MGNTTDENQAKDTNPNENFKPHPALEAQAAPPDTDPGMMMASALQAAEEMLLQSEDNNFGFNIRRMSRLIADCAARQAWIIQKIGRIPNERR